MKKMTFWASFLTMLCVIMSVSCSEEKKHGENDGPQSGNVSGTTWLIMSALEEDVFPVGSSIIFERGGSVSVEPQPDEWFGYARWKLADGILSIILGEDGPDDCLVGTFLIEGREATYSYYWKDYDGNWDNSDEVYTVIMRRQD